MGTPRDTLSITPAMWDTSSLESLPERVCLMGHGQQICLHVWVSALLYVPTRMSYSMHVNMIFAIQWKLSIEDPFGTCRLLLQFAMHPFCLLLSLSTFIIICTRTSTKCVCTYFTEVTIGSLTLSTSSYTVSCFLINCQGPVVPRAPCQMDRDATPAPLLGAESLTPVTQGI